MTTDQKNEIAELANQYITEKGLTAAKLAVLVDVNPSYLSNMLNGVFTVNAGGTPMEIADKYFLQIAEVVGYSMKKVYWPHIHTREFVELIALMKEAKEKQIMKTLIVDTGAGKTYAVSQFKRVNPLYTYVITMHSLVKINDLFSELMHQMGIPEKGCKGYKRAQILIKLRDIKKNGGSPIVLIDESENMNAEMMKMLKGFYDGISGYASMVLLGTEQLWDVMMQAKLKDKQSGPQFYRRFKPGTKRIRLQQQLEIRFKPFFEAMSIEAPLRKLLCQECANYGELHDYVEPALRAADAKGVKLTEDFFRVMYDMPR